MTERLGDTGESPDFDFRAFHSTFSSDEREGYLIARTHEMQSGRPTWIRRSGDPEDEGAVYDYFIDGQKVGFVDECLDDESLVFVISDEGVPLAYDDIPRPLNQTISLMESLF